MKRKPKFNAVWKDKRVPKEAKYIYSYIYSKNMNELLMDINVGELQNIIRITNTGLRKNLELLEKLKYLMYNEYSNGMYTITLS